MRRPSALVLSGLLGSMAALTPPGSAQEKPTTIEGPTWRLMKLSKLDDAELDQRTDEVVGRLAISPTVAISEMKNLLRGSAQRSLKEQLEAEAHALGVCAATEDFAEAIGAFMAKRKPAFKGR